MVKWIVCRHEYMDVRTRVVNTDCDVFKQDNLLVLADTFRIISIAVVYAGGESPVVPSMCQCRDRRLAGHQWLMSVGGSQVSNDDSAVAFCCAPWSIKELHENSLLYTIVLAIASQCRYATGRHCHCHWHAGRLQSQVCCADSSMCVTHGNIKTTERFV